MRNSPSLHIFANLVGEKMGKEKMRFELAFSICFDNSTFFDNERSIVKSNVGRILNEKKRGQQERKRVGRLNFLLAGSQAMMEEAHEFECPIQ